MKRAFWPKRMENGGGLGGDLSHEIAPLTRYLRDLGGIMVQRAWHMMRSGTSNGDSESFQKVTFIVNCCYAGIGHVTRRAFASYFFSAF